MKEKILAWIRQGCDINTGMDIYEKYGNNNRFLRLCRKSPKSHNDMLVYQLCRMAGISEKEFKQLVNAQKKTKKNNSPHSLNQAQTREEGAGSPFPGLNKKFREDYPFLEDTECPEEMKILAADKITAYYAYINAHKKLPDCTTLNECLDTARDVVENYIENRDIFNELNYYREHGHILGKHPLFKRRERLNELTKLSVPDLTKLLIKTLPHRIWRIESEINKNDKPDLILERRKRLADYKAELAHVKKLLNTQ